VLLSGGVFSAFLAVKSLPISEVTKSPTRPEGEDHDQIEDRLAG